jgi:hypothetical protein
MTPRVPVPRSAIEAEPAALNNVLLKFYAPRLRPSRRTMAAAINAMKSVDAVTSELVRIRNAKFQGCGL